MLINYLKYADRITCRNIPPPKWKKIGCAVYDTKSDGEVSVLEI